MKKRILAFLLFPFIGACGNKNRLNIKVAEDIKRKDIKIVLSALHGSSNIAIYENELQKPIPNLYGENDWVITYKDSITAKFRHIKTNRNDYHTYFFSIYKKGMAIMADFEVEGISELKKTLELSK
jgi:hypothetical protein